MLPTSQKLLRVPRVQAAGIAQRLLSGFKLKEAQALLCQQPASSVICKKACILPVDRISDFTADISRKRIIIFQGILIDRDRPSCAACERAVLPYAYKFAVIIRLRMPHKNSPVTLTSLFLSPAGIPLTSSGTSDTLHPCTWLSRAYPKAWLPVFRSRTAA